MLNAPPTCSSFPSISSPSPHHNTIPPPALLANFGLRRACKLHTIVLATGKESRNPVLLEDVSKMQIPVFSTNEVIRRLHNNILESEHHQVYRAMYSSIVEGIITDPAMMSVPLDDHMVHRGHGVFDTAMIVDGYIYALDDHLKRFLQSAAMAKISHTHSHSSLREILVQTVAASNCRQGSLRYWLSAGPGNFMLSPKECKQASFYAVVIEDSGTESAQGAKVITSTIPMKPPQFATTKTVNYLPNVLSQMEAEEHGAYAGIWVDDEGYVAEGPNINVAFVSHTGVLLLPPFDKILSGCTAKRMLALAPKLLSVENKLAEDSNVIDSQNTGHLKGIKVGQISITEAKNAAEMMLIGSGLPIKPVIEWDGKSIGNGQPGPVTLALMELLVKDMFSGPATERITVHYRDEQNEKP